MLCQLSYRGITHGTLLVAHSETKNCCTLRKKKLLHTQKKKLKTFVARFWPWKRLQDTQKRYLHVRESNPGRLRDRQKCYQLHQRGQPPARIELATLRLLSACSARLSYRGTCMLPTRIELATLGLWDPRAANCATGADIRVRVQGFDPKNEHLWCCACTCKKKLDTPTVGLEPTTTRLRVLRSTNWARRDGNSCSESKFRS